MIIGRKTWCSAALCLTVLLPAGCTTLRHDVIPQDEKGPHGGPLTFIDQRVPEYVECVIIPGDKDWAFQVFYYDKDLKPKDIPGSGRVEVTLPDGTKKETGLWNTRPYFWSKGIGHIENKLALGNVKEFSVRIIIHNGPRYKEHLAFNYPY